ncbi:altronate dehydratase family protein [Micromonospora sp. WMMD882]|uniref:UxaA family hydrolase n=1 Tax=Micromonospora sp. WMMD882 TaxID=3015151 RepID=UPI00248BD1D8|nr:altronate dehydratase family protein [Micromonospora sp. WMMD882]WBB80324.1 altronate dehydratase family protein [Micromonospora sp. WMMD882]
MTAIPQAGGVSGATPQPDRTVPVALARSRRTTIRLHPDDDVVVACYGLTPGDRLDGEGVTVRDPLPAGHKIATRAIAAGERVLRYGQIIGVATRDIAPGAHVHVHNLGMVEFERELAPAVDARPTGYVPTPATFLGLRRADGRAATRNYIALISSVNCSATVVRAIADHFRRDIHPEALADYPNVDGVVPITHGVGCAVDPQGLGLKVLQRTLRGYAQHPNFGAVVAIGLGCETNQLDDLLEVDLSAVDRPVASFNMQDVGGTARSIRRGIELVTSLLPEVNDVRRTPVPAAELVVGLQCGGSDGYSGITANPALGAAVDRLVRHGGTAILSETPEIYGAEHLLARRAHTPAVARRLLDRFAWWQEYADRMQAELNNNPSAGNKAGGLTTVLEKSLGGVSKGGSTDLMEVYEYAERVREHGLVFMDTPGFDPVSATGQVAGGANLICFTTGRGSAYGCQPTPSLKLASNNELWLRQREDIDINCGDIVSGFSTVDEVGEQIFQRMLSCASGQRSVSELFGYGQNEFVPWQLSAVM